MSLVNDMLRDLDNRRKESGGSASTVKLTPAPEIASDIGRKPIALYFVIALLIGAGVIVWFWTQQNSDGSTRQLEIAPIVVNNTTEIPINDEESVSTPQQSITPQELDVADSENIETNTQPIAEQFSEDSVSETLAENQQFPATENQTQAADRSVALSEDTLTSIQSDNNVEANFFEDGLASNDLTEDGGTEIVDLSDSPAQEVKNAAELTPEEYDLLAVQEALRLIAENKNPEAYLVLEEQIRDNRYAHQSRETYAKLLFNEGNLLGAYELNEAGLMLSPNHPGFKKVKARILIADGQLDAAVDLLLSRAPEVGEDLEYHDILATAQFASRDYEGALISYTELVQSDQSQGKWWYGFAASQDSLGNAVAARQAYTQAVQQPNLSASLRRRSQERLASLSQ